MVLEQKHSTNNVLLLFGPCCTTCAVHISAITTEEVLHQREHTLLTKVIARQDADVAAPLASIQHLHGNFEGFALASNSSFTFDNKI